MTAKPNAPQCRKTNAAQTTRWESPEGLLVLGAWVREDTKVLVSVWDDYPGASIRVQLRGAAKPEMLLDLEAEGGGFRMPARDLGEWILRKVQQVRDGKPQGIQNNLLAVVREQVASCHQAIQSMENDY